MTPKAKKRIWDGVRVALCVAALGIVIQGVTWDDRLTLAEDGSELRGTVIDQESEQQYHIERSDGTERTVAYAEVAQDEQGAPRVEYGLKSVWRESDKGLLALCIVVFLPVAFFLGARLKLLLSVQDVHISLFEGIKLSFAGNFLNFAAPLGSNAGDVFKAYFVSLHTEHKTEAATTVFIDRVIGLGTLLLVVAVLTLASPGTSRLGELRWYVVSVILVGGAAGLAYLSPLGSGLMAHRFMARLPGGRHLARIDGTVRSLARRPGVLVGAVLYTVTLQVIAIGAYFVVAQALGLRGGWSLLPEYYAYFATGAVVQALPGPPQGFGTVELAYRYLFAPFGGVSQIVSMALAIRLMTLICALPGVYVVLTGSYRPRTSLLPEPIAPDPVESNLVGAETLSSNDGLAPD